MDRRVALLLVAAACASCGRFSPSADDLRNNPHGHLIWAARMGDVAAIDRLAASGIDLDVSSVTPLVFVFPDFDHRGWTALQHAAQKGHVDAVRVLLEWGADPDARPEGTYPALLISTGHQDPAIGRLLLDAGADLDLSRKLLVQEEPGGPLWHVVEHTVERVSGRQSPKEGLERIAASQPRQP